jgi:hypothetical protein
VGELEAVFSIQKTVGVVAKLVTITLANFRVENENEDQRQPAD